VWKTKSKPDEFELRVIKTLEEGNQPNIHLSFFKGIIPSLQNLNKEETLEFQMGVLQLISHINLLNAELNPICYLLALLAHHFLHLSRIRVKSLTLRLLMSCIYGAPILDVSRSHTTTHHSR